MASVHRAPVGVLFGFKGRVSVTGTHSTKVRMALSGEEVPRVVDELREFGRHRDVLLQPPLHSGNPAHPKALELREPSERSSEACMGTDATAPMPSARTVSATTQSALTARRLSQAGFAG